MVTKAGPVNVQGALLVCSATGFTVPPQPMGMMPPHPVANVPESPNKNSCQLPSTAITLANAETDASDKVTKQAKAMVFKEKPSFWTPTI